MTQKTISTRPGTALAILQAANAANQAALDEIRVYRKRHEEADGASKNEISQEVVRTSTKPTTVLKMARAALKHIRAYEVEVEARNNVNNNETPSEQKVSTDADILFRYKRSSTRII